MIFDSHAHYDDDAFKEDREAVINGLKDKGVGRVVNVSSSLETVTSSLQLASQYAQIYAAVGVHPNETEPLNEESFTWLRQQCRQPKVVAVGEIGLDYYWDEPSRDVQKRWFIRQLHMAREEKLPVIIHSRDAAQDTLEIMKQEHAEQIGGVIHCFSYSVEMAKEYLDMGFYIGIGGVLTFKNARKLKEVAEYVPLEHIVIETDCPYLAPVPFRGKRNDSGYLRYVVEELASIKKTDPNEIINITEQNACRLYSL